MNRRTFFRAMLAAACTAAARAYVPAALSVAAPRYVDKFVWSLDPDSCVDSVPLREFRGFYRVRIDNIDVRDLKPMDWSAHGFVVDR